MCIKSNVRIILWRWRWRWQWWWRQYKWKCRRTWDAMKRILEQWEQLTQCRAPHPSGWRWWYSWWWWLLWGWWKPACDENGSSERHVEAAKEQVGHREVDDEDCGRVPHLMIEKVELKKKSKEKHGWVNGCVPKSRSFCCKIEFLRFSFGDRCKTVFLFLFMNLRLMRITDGRLGFPKLMIFCLTFQNFLDSQGPLPPC